MIKQFTLSLAALCFCMQLCSQVADTTYMVTHKSVFTVDSHTDTPLRLMDGALDFGSDNRGAGNCVDLPKMKTGSLDGVFFAVFLRQDDRTPEKHKLAYLMANKIIDTVEQVVMRNWIRSEIATTPVQALDMKVKGRKAVFLGIENGYALGHDISAVNHFYKRGVRYITLCHTKNNDLCDSSNDTIGYGGLSGFGMEVVREMNRVGMMIDVSHISDSSFYQVIRLSAAPVIASHSCSRAVCNNRRNLTDDMLLKLKENGGVIQLCILSDYVKDIPQDPERDSAFKALSVKYNGFSNLSDEEMKMARKEWYALQKQYPARRATVADAVDHIDHIVKLIGIDYVGIGTDFDGGGGLADCSDASQLPSITKELIKRGYSKEDIGKIWGGNLFRVMNRVAELSGH